MKITDEISVVKGIGPKKTERLRNKGLQTLEDLLHNFPKEYEDRRKVMPIKELKVRENALIEAEIKSKHKASSAYRKNTPLKLTVSDGTGNFTIVFFNAKYLSRELNKGISYSFYGKVSENQGVIQMVNPEFHELGSPDDVRGLVPVYKTIDGIYPSEMRKLEDKALSLMPEIKEWLPDYIVEKYRLADLGYAIRNLHIPEGAMQYKMAKYRMVFEELLILQTGMMYSKYVIDEETGVRIATKDAYEFINSLKFELTSDQKRTWEEISQDLSSAKSMNRLIQGDVGSGKTVIAEIAMFCAAKSGFQAAMMVPTEILAKQHFESLKSDFGPFGIKVSLLCASMKESDKRDVLEGLKNGNVDVLVGTHAVIQPGVLFSKLGLVITDEQHRFGVRQRRLLSDKNPFTDVNVMLMTATPIPRTLAVLLYGELDVSMIKTMPKGRKKIITKIANEKNRREVYDFMRRKLKEGRQAYVVAPLIEESDVIDARSAEEIYEELRNKFSDYRVALIHGALKQEEKDDAMNRFAMGEIDVLVSTVVIEVGIDVPNATVMVIENSERFGLSQMHQLRGRVGRGNYQSYCFLILQKESEIAKERAQIMEKTSDGFEIAEQDLLIRGPGEIFGTRQHGLPELNVSDVLRHKDVLEKAREASKLILEKDPALKSEENGELVRRIEKLFNGRIRLEL